MRYLTGFVLSAVLIVSEVVLASASVPTIAQIQNSAQQKAASLRTQLSEVETKQAELQTRLQQLEEGMKPENIAENLAGIGSTKPEQLREQRRRQLEIERNGVQRQLDLLSTSHSRLETAIAQADAEAYRQSAVPAPATVTANSPTTSASASATTTPARPRRVKKRRARSLRH
jgi:Skp family chaperone for outer membrane proteins